MEVNQLQQYFGTWQEFLRSIENCLHYGDKTLKTKCTRFFVCYKADVAPREDGWRSQRTRKPDKQSQ